MRVASIVGARPQFIKVAAVSRAFAHHNRRSTEAEQVEEVIIHTGQHYDYGMSQVFFEELEIPEPHHNLGVGSGSHGDQTGEILKRLEPVLLAERPERVLVYGDTNSTLAAALAASKLHIPVAHVEAGLRSYKKAMPEEINRVLSDHVSTLLFCPTETAVRNLQEEGFDNVAYEGTLAPVDLSQLNLDCTSDDPVVTNVGDVMFDSVLCNLELAERSVRLLEELELAVEDYYVATVHRAENTDDLKRLEEFFSAFQEIAASGTKLVCPLHPRTRKALSHLRLGEWHPNLIVIEPVSYLKMLLLERGARLVLTDSGGVQKEAFMLRKPCITLREETEWVETVEAGWNTLAGADRGRILEAVEHFGRRRPAEPQVDPYGDGRAGERIAQAVVSLKR